MALSPWGAMITARRSALYAGAFGTAFGTADFAEVTLYTSGSGNYTIPEGASALTIQLKGGGGGGGSGRRGAAGTVRCGGGPGGNGATVELTVAVSELLAVYPSGVIPYSVGAGGAGGAAVTTNDTDGNAGAIGGQSTFGTGENSFRALQGNNGMGGTATSGTGGFSFIGTWPMLPVNSASASGGTAVNTNFGGPGPGGGITSGNVASAGTAGLGAFTPGTGGSGGVVDGAAPGSGQATTIPFDMPAPGGGAASITTAAQAGANALANSGRGGGGGGASLNGNNSGAGGNGGSGYIRIVAIF